jgi:hypothetical protein
VVDQDGSLYRVDTTTGSKTRIATLQEGLDNLAFDAKDRLFVSNADHGWVVEVLPGGTVRDLLRGGAIVPGGIAVVPSDGIDEAGAVDERIVVADVWSLRQYDGKTGRSLGYIIFPVGSGSPFTVAARGDQLVLSGWFDNGVRLYDLAARQVIWQDFFAVPLNAGPFGDDIAVSELLTGRVVRASDHSPLVSTPYVYVPAGLAARDGELWVVDWATGLLWKIAEAGTPLVPPRLVASGLSFPEGLAVDSDGSLLVVETGARRLSRVDPATGAVTVLIDDLELGLPAVPGTAPTAYFNGLAVGSEGAIYVTGDAGTQVYRYQPGSR